MDQSHMERIFRNSPEYQACAECKNNCLTTDGTYPQTVTGSEEPSPIHDAINKTVMLEAGTQDCSFVEELYLTILCRPGKAHGIQFYKGLCAKGMDQSHMERIFRNSPEYQACAECKNNCLTTDGTYPQTVTGSEEPSPMKPLLPTCTVDIAETNRCPVAMCVPGHCVDGSTPKLILDEVEDPFAAAGDCCVKQCNFICENGTYPQTVTDSPGSLPTEA